jgi:hypothetical protein
MNIRGLWTKLFSQNDESDEIALHVSGATVRHRNPFETIDVPRNEVPLTQDFSDKWVAPFYMSRLWGADEQVISSFMTAAKEIDPDIVSKLLGDFDWRARICGAYLAAVKNYKQFEDIIGKHLLKSEVSYAGAGYCLALAIFETDNAKNYLKTYLEYYLDRNDLWFDQADAFCAIEYLDKTLADGLFNKYQDFVSDKPYWNLDQSKKHFKDSILTIKKIQDAAKT